VRQRSIEVEVAVRCPKCGFTTAAQDFWCVVNNKISVLLNSVPVCERVCMELMECQGSCNGVTCVVCARCECYHEGDCVEVTA